MKFSNNKYLALALGAVALTGCTDALDPLPLTYKEDPNFAAPHIQDAWNLEDISDMAADRVYAYKDHTYDDLFTRTLGWNGGDGVQTTLLPDGNLFWTFNDSFYGVVDAETRARGACSFPRNSTMVQAVDPETGALGERDEFLHWLASFVQTTNPNADRYYQARTHIRHPQATLSDADIQRGEIDQNYLYWAGDGTIVDGKLQQLWMGVNTPGNGDMLPLNTCLAIYSLEGQPGDESYLKMESADHNFIPDNPYGYGSTLWEDEDGHTYLYSTCGTGEWLQNAAICARSKTHDLRSGWEYYVPNDLGEMVWQEEYPSQLQAQNSSIAPGVTLSLPWVFKYGDYYYMTAQAFPYGKELLILRGEHPYGPFTDSHVLLKFSDKLDKIGVQEYQNLYMFHLHWGLSREDELVISTNSDTANFWDNFNAIGSADFYRPFFYRIFKWQRVFDD
jgi:hypothetical protein